VVNLGDLLQRALAGVLSEGLWPGMGPDGVVAPYGTYLHFGEMNWTLSGRAPEQRQRVQIDIYAESKDASRQLADSVQERMDAYSMEDSPSMFTSTQLSREYMGQDEANGFHRFMLEFSVWYRP
jgi:hypothetical protein